MILGITGTLGAGKGTVVDYLKTKGFSHYSSSAILKEMVHERGLPAIRQNLSSLADEIMNTYKGGIVHFSNERALKDNVQDYILEALHRVSEAEFIHSIGGYIIGIDADVDLRFSRVIARKEGEKDNVTYEQFLQDSAREDEGKTGTGPNINAVLKMADYTIVNNISLANLHEQVDVILTKIGK